MPSFVGVEKLTGYVIKISLICNFLFNFRFICELDCDRYNLGSTLFLQDNVSGGPLSHFRVTDLATNA